MARYCSVYALLHRKLVVVEFRIPCRQFIIIPLNLGLGFGLVFWCIWKFLKWHDLLSTDNAYIDRCQCWVQSFIWFWEFSRRWIKPTSVYIDTEGGLVSYVTGKQLLCIHLFVRLFVHSGVCSYFFTWLPRCSVKNRCLTASLFWQYSKHQITLTSCKRSKKRSTLTLPGKGQRTLAVMMVS